MKIILGSVKLCLSLSEDDCFCALQNETIPESFNAVYISKNYLYFIKNKHPCLCFLTSFYNIITGTSYVFGIKLAFILKMDTGVHDGFIRPS